jgi:mannose-1-phosphate guanylyltransferase/mannose-6-phosphate isomerase
MACITPVVLSGGNGTRLWPASRTCQPKQFLSLTSKWSLLQETLMRFDGEPGFNPPVVIGNEEHRFLIGAQAQGCGVPVQALLVEPVARDTAPAIAASAAWLVKRDPAALMLVIPADQIITQPVKLAESIRLALPAAESGWIVTFGVRPSAPETGYGYVEQNEAEIADGVWQVRSFVEKPDRERAEQFVAGGVHHWNSGILLCRAATLLSDLKHHAPQVHGAAVSAVNGCASDLDFVRLGIAAFGGAPRISIDYALLQQSQRVAVCPLADVGWSDVGSWEALYRASPHDERGNVTIGDAVILDTEDTYAYLPDGRQLVTMDVKSLLIVSTPDAILVANRGRAQEVRAIVDQLRAKRPELVELNRRMYRPWGFYETLHLGDRHHVKHILVQPGGCLSLQRHYHRSEHWVVVKGTARVTLNGEVREISENASIYLPLGSCHRLENPGRIPLELIEVQTGSYLGEDDIERLEDVYGRVDREAQPKERPAPLRLASR